MSILKLTVSLLLAAFFTAGPGLAAVGSWNGIGFTAWNGVAITSWNGTSISTGGGGGAWYYIQENTFNGADSSLAPANITWGDVTAVTGTATQLGIHIATVNFAGTIRLMIYDSGGTLLQNAVTATISTTGWHDVSITPQAVTAGTYILAYIGQDNDALDVSYNTSSGTTYYEAGQSGTAPASLPTPLGSFTGKMGMRVWIE